MIKTYRNTKIDAEKPFNHLPTIPPSRKDIETMKVLQQTVRSSVVLSELKGLANTLPNPTILLNAVILKEAKASSEIENVITTHDKLYQALSIKATESDAATKEVLRYREGMLYGYHFIQKKGYLNTNAIIDIQKILENNNAGIRKLPGTALKNATTGKLVYTPPNHYDTIIRLMKNLEIYLNGQDDLSPLIKMAVQHYQFESIHPFYDGNGRTGRIINILYLILQGMLVNPILYLSSYIIDNKANYYRLLQEVRTKNNWEEWILYILKGIEHTAKVTIVQIHAIQALFIKTQALVKKKAPKIYSKELIELLFEQPYSKIEYLTERLKISRVTASKYLKTLEKIGMLTSRQVWKETLYINTKLFDMLKN